MISKKQTFTFGDVTFTVDPKKPYVTMTLNGLHRSIKKNELWTMVFAISSKKKQADLIPVVKKDMVQFMRQVEIRATKDIKAGDMVKFHIPVNIERTVVQAALNAEQKQSLQDIPSPFAPEQHKEV